MFAKLESAHTKTAQFSKVRLEGFEAPLGISAILQHLDGLVEVNHILDAWVANALGGNADIHHNVRPRLSCYPTHTSNQGSELALFFFREWQVWKLSSVLVEHLVLQAFNGIDLFQRDRLVSMLD